MEHQPKDPSGRWLFLVIGAFIFALIWGVNAYKEQRDKSKSLEKDPVEMMEKLVL